MSYSLAITEGPKAGFRSRCEQEIENYLVSVGAMQGQPVEEVRDHLWAALDAAELLAGVIGGDEDIVAGSISGHANVGHGSVEGMSGETINVSFRVVRQ